MKALYKPVLLAVLAISISFPAFGQKICFHDAISLQKTENVQYSTDNKEWKKVTESCFDLPQDWDSLYVKSPGYADITLTKADYKAGTPIYLNPDYHTLQEVVVSATRSPERKRDVTQEIHGFKAAEINRTQAATTGDLLMQSGEVFVQKSQAAGGSPVLRGFEANRILMVVDGVRMNNLMFRAGHLQNIISVDPFILDNIDVLMGPSSVMYGSDAMGGVIHMRSRKPMFLDSNATQRWHGQIATRGYSATLGTHLHTDIEYRSKNWASLSSATWYRAEDLKAGKSRKDSYEKWGLDTFYVEPVNGKDSAFKNPDTHIQKFSGYQQLDLMQKFLIRTSENSKLIINTQFSTSTDLPRYDRLEQVKSKKARYAEWYYGPQKRMLNYIKWEEVKKRKVYDRLYVQGAWQNYVESRHQRNFRDSMEQHRIENATVLSANIDAVKRFGKHELRYGTEVTAQTLKSKANNENILTGNSVPLDTRYPDGGNKMNTAGVYIFDAVELSEKWIAQGAARYNYTYLHSTFKDTTFFKFPFRSATQQHQALNGSASIVWIPVKKIKNVLLFSSAFKAPNVDDMSKIFESTKGKLVIPNENIEPERTYTMEYGFEVIDNKRIHFQARAFYTWYHDVMTLAPDQYQGQDSVFYDGILSQVFSMQNKGKAYIYGGFSSLWLKFGDFQVLQNATVTTARIQVPGEDLPLDHIPPFIGKSSLMYSKKKVTAEIFALYNGMKPIKEFSLSGEDNIDQTLPTGSPSWITYNLRTQFSPTPTLVLSFAVENILDTYYRPFASGIAGSGRNFVVGVKAQF